MCWDEIGERELTGPEIIQGIAEKVASIMRRLETTTSRQKKLCGFEAQKCRILVGDYVFLKVSPMKGVMRFGKK